jgi:hypothetical protein
MSQRFARWSDLWRPWFLDPRRFLAISVLLPIALTTATVVAPIPTAILLFLGLIGAWFWRSDEAIVLVMVALMGNVKINYYTGYLTIFPEFIPLALACGIAVLRWLDGDRAPSEPALQTIFAVFVIAGFLSVVNAIDIGRVISKGIMVAVSGLIFFVTIRGLRRRSHMERALLWLEWSAAVVALYGIVQFAGAFFGVDLSLRFFERWGNPAFHYGIGTRFYMTLSSVLRAHSFFNDPNILAGYIAGAGCVVLALRLHHGATGMRRRAVAETGLMALLGLCLLLTISRSGFIALLCGAVVVLAFMPEVLRRFRFWAAGVAGLCLAAAASTWLGTNPLLLLVRLSSSFDQEELSTRIHLAVAGYSMELLRRFPLTGCGLRNFGFYYASEVDAEAANMIAHDVYLSYLAETGLIGGLAFIVLVAAILWRPWRALRDPALRATDPELYAWNAGLLGALVALNVANVFYDYYLKTFVWVLSGMAVVAARLWERRDRPVAAT